MQNVIELLVETVKSSTWEFFYEGYRLAESNSTQQSRDRTDDEIRAMYENEFEASQAKLVCDNLILLSR